MNSLFKYGSVQENPLYSCSVPFEELSIPGTKRVLLGYALIIFGIFVEIIYIPSLIAMIKKKLLRFSCYKIMFCLGLVDMYTTLICTILSGYLFIEGAVYCSYPTLIYITGCFALGGWIMSCGFTLLLVINRVTDIVCPNFSEIVFNNNRAWLTCVIPLVYGLYCIFFTPAIIFNSTIMAWIGDPGITAGHSGDYYNYVQVYNNFVFIFSTIALYSLYCVFMQKKQNGIKVSSGKQVFIQSSIICSINCSSASVYTLLMFIKPNPIIVIIGELAWSMVHGFPAIIYLTMNRTIRNEVLGWFKKSDNRVGEISNSRQRTLESI